MFWRVLAKETSAYTVLECQDCHKTTESFYIEASSESMARKIITLGQDVLYFKGGGPCGNCFLNSIVHNLEHGGLTPTVG